MHHSGSGKTACIVAYDVHDGKVRSRLSSFLLKRGVRLQESVFTVQVERHVYGRFLREMEAIVGADGNVMVLRLCRGCQAKALEIAPGGHPGFWVV